jgi:hypothetical protein
MLLAEPGMAEFLRANPTSQGREKGGKNITEYQQMQKVMVHEFRKLKLPER